MTTRTRTLPAKLGLSAVVATGIVAVLAGVAFAQPARPQAQTVPPPPPAAPAPAPSQAVPTDPDRTTASFGDWLLRCERQADGQRVCDAAQTLVLQGQTQPIALIAFSRPTRGQPLLLTVQVPTSATFANPLRVTGEDREPLVIEVPWRRCVPAGCFADVQLRDEAAMRRLRARTEPGRIEFRDGANREIALPFSLRGLAPALDALVRD